MVIAAVLVVFMQVGFLAFNTASVHPKHAQTVVAAIILNFIACGLGYTLIGYGLMFGAPQYPGMCQELNKFMYIWSAIPNCRRFDEHWI